MMDYDDDPDIENNKEKVEKTGDTSLAIAKDPDLKQIALATRRRITKYNATVKVKEVRVTTGVKKIFGREINKGIAESVGVNPMSILSPKAAITRLELTHHAANNSLSAYTSRSQDRKKTVATEGYHNASKDLGNLIAAEVDAEYRKLFEVCIANEKGIAPKKRSKESPSTKKEK